VKVDSGALASGMLAPYTVPPTLCPHDPTVTFDAGIDSADGGDNNDNAVSL